MDKKYSLIFDEIMLSQLKKFGKRKQITNILSKMFNKIELIGPFAGKLLDSQLQIYEMKNMHPPIRLYFKHNKITNEIYLFEFEMKTSEKKQEETIKQIKRKILKS